MVHGAALHTGADTDIHTAARCVAVMLSPGCLHQSILVTLSMLPANVRMGILLPPSLRKMTGSEPVTWDETHEGSRL